MAPLAPSWLLTAEPRFCTAALPLRCPRRALVGVFDWTAAPLLMRAKVPPE
jgi:hypothetical protein